jgi:hypothetical protein
VPSPTRLGARAAAIVAVVVLAVLAIWLTRDGRRQGPQASGDATASAGTTTARSSGAPTAGAAGSSPLGGSPAAQSAVPTGGAAILVGAGDIAACTSTGDEATADLLDSIGGTVFTLGDNAYEKGTADEFRRCYDPSWGRQLARTMPVPGNHDYATPGASGYFGYFGAAAGDPAKGWYAYDRGAWRIYALNSNCIAIGGCDAGSPQERWLRNDLATNPRACVLAMWHHPRFSSGPHGNDPSTQDLWMALYAASAELVLNGHDHDYERFAPQTPTGELDPDRGLVEIVAGTGGRSHYDFEMTRANGLVRNDKTNGVLRLALADGGWSFEFIPVPGSPFSDSGTGTCH